MSITKTKNEKKKQRHSPSVNIIRDLFADLNYIPTPNSKLVYNQLINDFQVGIRSFNIVGAYGIGKSAFLCAFVNQINGKKKIFAETGVFAGSKGYEIIPFVGDFSSLIGAFVEKFDITLKNLRTGDVIKKIDKYYSELEKKGKGMVILIDEFGKFLEYASQHSPEKELYFIQQLAEYINNEEKNTFLVTTLHQDFNGYAKDLTIAQQNEWDKVKGRLKEITFNEPVEQLIFLAASRLEELALGTKDKNFNKLFKAIENAKAFPLKDYFNVSYAEKLLPFDILSAGVMTLALQKYGQNERSLFSFIESNDHLGLRDFSVKNAPYYNLGLVYDYLIHNYYSHLTTKYNLHYAQWAAIKTAIENVEGSEIKNISDAVMIVKSIGLLNIFATASIRLDKNFLGGYSQYSLGIKDPLKIIKALEGLRVIRYARHMHKYILSQGTDLDIELAIDEAGNLVQKVTSVVHHLNQYFEFGYISAKAAFYIKGIPRFFAFHISEFPFSATPYGEIDGFVNLVFSEDVREEEIVNASVSCQEPILFGWYRNTAEIKKLIFEIEKIKRVKEDHLEDKVAIRELNKILEHQVKLLNHFVIGNMYDAASPVKWYYGGREVEIIDRKTFNQTLSAICFEVYNEAPSYRNEMVNKSKLSSPIVSARKNFIATFIQNSHQKDLGFEENKFPPEKTIYLSLLRETGIHRQDEEGLFSLGAPTNDEFEMQPLWRVCDQFLESTKHAKRSVQELSDILLNKPIKVKQGFIDFWLVIFLYANRNDFALFHEDIYIASISAETMDLVLRDPKEYYVKKFNIDGVNLDLFNSYRALLNQSQHDRPTGEVFVETIKPFLTFYRQLPQYAKTTESLKKRTLALRDAIAFAKNPEDTFFDEFPKAIGYDKEEMKADPGKLKTYVDELQESIREIRSCYDALILRVEEFIGTEVTDSKEFPGYKDELQARFKFIKKHLLLPYQKVFYQRLYSETDDKGAWLNSIVQACVGKPLETIADQDEISFYDSFKDIVHELDNLNDISKSGFDEKKEIAFKLEVTSFVEGLKKNLVRLPISKNKELVQLQSVIKAKLTKDKQLNIATLAKILEEILTNEKD